ncbi:MULTISPECIES: endonuclease NucS domain-containing protein [Limnospira]|uniref:Endonuclease NucS C-terminal domain-containing protein n=2 Tax=Limnospira TaxID=2596745 RepID=A0A9P1NZQ3_9CYAN|nr:endonuclease NucS domain-containing protein [Limnospira indica]CDM96541.1 conserved protein of unknown function [Limnospira indica PCC 8005]
MFDGYALQNNGGEWGFVNEEALENFLYRNLEQLLKIQPLERQYNVESQRCDILAVGDRQKLVVLELKNAEDRGIVQQLTRYYDALLGEKPFGDRVDYDKPVQLIAIAPSFHRDNFTDKKYHTLDFQFLQFSVIENQDQFYLCLRDVDSNTVSRVKIPYQKPPTDLELPPIPTALAKMMKNCEPYQQKILEIREKILLFDNRIQEISSANSIKYGNGKAKNSKFCAEFMSYKDEIILFLWIPYKMGESTRIGRARIWTNWQDRALIEGYVSKEVGNEINQTKRQVQKIIDAINQGGYECWISMKSCDYFGFPFTLILPVKNSVGKKYVQAIKRICSYSKHKKNLVYEEIYLSILHKNLCHKIIKNESMREKFKALPSEIWGYDRSLQSLLDLALEKWSDRV